MRKTISFFLIFILHASVSWAEISTDPQNKEKKEAEMAAPLLLNLWPEGSSLDLGFRIGTSVLQVKDNSNNTLLAEMQSVALPAPTFTLSSPFETWRTSGLGYKVEFGFSWFTIKNQKVDGELIDVGTSADGYSVYLTPTLGYLFGDRRLVDGQGRSLLIGIGLGGGYLVSRGRVQLTNTGSGQEFRDFDFNQLTFAALIVLESRWNRWNFEIQVGGPNLTDKDLKFEFFDTSVQISRSFTTEDFSSKPGTDHRRLRENHIVTLFGGGRQVPILSNQEYLSEEEKLISGGGIEYHYTPTGWPLGFVADISFFSASPQSTTTSIFPQGDDLPVTLESQLLETHFGFRVLRKLGKNRWLGHLGGGVATFYTKVTGEIDGRSVEDNAIDFGYWLGGGIGYMFSKKWAGSLQLRFVSVQTELLDVFEEGASSTMRIGADYRF